MATRYRCDACGNLTRFTVTKMTRTREFMHYTLNLDAEYQIDEQEVLEETVEKVECRWCRIPGKVVVIDEYEREVIEGNDSA